MSFPTDRPPRVLMFAPAFAPNFFSEALVNSKLALAMHRAGWDVTTFASASTGQVYAGSWEAPWEPLRKVRHDPSPWPRGLRGLPGRVIGAIRARYLVSGALWSDAAARQASALHSEAPFDLVMSRSTSCVAHLPALLFRSGIRGGTPPPWIANWNDPPGHRFPPPYDFPLPHLQRLLKDRYLRAAAASADINSFPSKQLREYLREPLRLSDTGFNIVIPHIGLGWRPEIVRDKDRKRFRFTHAGNLAGERNPAKFLTALSKLAARNPDVRFEFEIIGHIDSSSEEYIASLGLANNIVLSGGLPYLACLEQLAQADAQVLIEAPCEHGIFLPSKLADYIEVGRPILALSPRVGAVRDLMEQHGFGYPAANDSEAEIEAALERLFKDWCAESAADCSEGLDRMRELVHPQKVVLQIKDALEQFEGVA